MKVWHLERTLYIGLLVIFAGIVVHAPLTVWLGTVFPDASLLIKAWKEILMLLLVPITGYLLFVYGKLTSFLRDPLVLLIVLFAAIHFWSAALFYQGTTATFAGFAIDLRFLLFLTLVYAAVQLQPTWRRGLLISVGVGAFVVTVFGALQLILPIDVLANIGYSRDTIAPYLTVDKNYDFIRINSTLRGPNPLGAYVGIIFGLLTAVLVKGKLALRDRRVLSGVIILAVCGAITLWTSYSRSALVAAIAIVGVVVFATLLRKVSPRTWIASVAIVFALAGGLFVSRESDFVSHVILHEDPDGGSPTKSNDEHVSSLEYGAGQMIREPFGAGVGSTGSASLLGDDGQIVENQYFFVSHETGWAGLATFLGIFGLVMWRLWQRRADWLALGVFASGVGMALIGILLPVWADDTVAIIWWGLAGIALAGQIAAHKKERGGNGRRSTKQKATRTA